jgi:hypothetical protein
MILFSCAGRYDAPTHWPRRILHFFNGVKR